MTDWQDIVFGDTPTPDTPKLTTLTTPITAGASAYGASALEKECAQLAATTTGRNNQLNRAAFNLASLVEAGHLDRQQTIDALTAAAHTASTRGDHPLTDQEIDATLRSAFRGNSEKVGARAVPDRPPLELAVTTLDPAEIITTQPANGAATTNGANGNGHHNGHTRRPDINAVFEAEGEFWTTRESLKHIYRASLGRMCSPWAVLAHCAARALGIVRPCATLPPLVGGPGSLNWFGIVVAPSGGGKSAAEDVARELLDITVEQRSLGSGEGLMESFLRPENKVTGEPAGQYESILFLADESDTISALSARSGSTLLSTLRTAWTGRTLSFGYRGRTTERIEAHTYRATLVMAMQPSRAGWILADSGGGTPQRFQWFPGTDKRITLDGWSGDPIYPLTLPSWREWEFGHTLSIPDTARDTILKAREKGAQGDQDALDGHALFCREKFAYALTVLDGRAEMTDEDWQLSGIAADVSSRTREWVTASVESESYLEAEERGRLMGVSSAASDEEKAHRAAGRLKRISGLILSKLDDGPMTEGELRRNINSRDRPWLPGALQALQAAGMAAIDDEKRWSRTND